MTAKKVVLISCSKAKRSYPCAARQLYDASALFRKSLAYAESVSDDVLVLSAKHGLVELDEVISPYDETLSDKSASELAAWGKTAGEQLSERYDVSCTEFIILAGKNYYYPLRPYLPSITLPLLGLPMFERLAKLDRLIQVKLTEQASLCYRLHKLFNNMPRLRWNEIDSIGFDSGIYIVFEDGEKYNDMDRIVRAGTHRSDGRLRGRLKDHFVVENKDGSIFRKNIGRAILNKNRHPYLDIWNANTGKPETVARLGDRYDPVFQQKLEKQISNYLRKHFSFVCFPVPSQAERLRLEEGIIATLNLTSDFAASPEWRGRHSSENEIVQSGMWLKEGLCGVPLFGNEYYRIEELCFLALTYQQNSSAHEDAKSFDNHSDTGSAKKTNLEYWHRIISAFSNTKAEIHTTPISKTRTPLWFTVFTDGNDIYVGASKEKQPSSKISSPRKLNFSEFERMYPIYQKRKAGQAVSAEAKAASQNQVYWYAIMNYCNL